jgi:hypothetical protein
VHVEANREVAIPRQGKSSGELRSVMIEPPKTGNQLGVKKS